MRDTTLSQLKNSASFQKGVQKAFSQELLNIKEKSRKKFNKQPNHLLYPKQSYEEIERKELDKFYTHQSRKLIEIEKILIAFTFFGINYETSEIYQLFQYKNYEFLQSLGCLSEEALWWYCGVRLFGDFNIEPSLWVHELKNYLKYDQSLRAVSVDRKRNKVTLNTHAEARKRIESHRKDIERRFKMKRREATFILTDEERASLSKRGYGLGFYSNNSYDFKENQFRYLTLSPLIEELIQKSKGSNTLTTASFVNKAETVMDLTDFDLIKEFDRVFGVGGRPYIRVTGKDGVTSLPVEMPLRLRGDYTVWLGSLGVGKSNLRLALVKYLVEKHLQRIVIIESEVINVMKLVKDLRGLGLKATPLISRKNKYHVDNLLDSKDLFDRKNLEALCGLDGNCLLTSSMEDDPTVNSEELLCDDLIYEGKSTKDSKTPSRPQHHPSMERKKCECPLITVCPKMECFRQLGEAEVIVTTTAFLTKGRIPNAFNPKGLSTLEFLQDWANFLIADEIDQIQMNLDRSFIKNEVISRDGKISGVVKGLIDAIESKRIDGSEAAKKVVSSIRFNHSELVKIIVTLDNFSRHQQCLAEVFKGENAYSYLKIAQIVTTLLTNHKVSEGEISSLTSVLQTPFSNDIKRQFPNEEARQKILASLSENPVYRAISNSISYQSEDDVFTLQNVLNEIEKVCLEYIKTPLPKFVLKELIEWSLLYILLCDLDRLYTWIGYDTEKLKRLILINDEQIKAAGRAKNRMDKFVPEPLIDIENGYLMKRNDYDTLDIDSNEYLGMGRALLETISRVKPHDIVAKTKVIAMSGTCDIPQSSDYHCHIEPTACLERLNIETGEVIPGGDLKMVYIPTKIKNSDNYVKSSGSKALENSYTAILSNLVNQGLLPQGTNFSPGTQNKLLVTGSYEETETVVRILQSLDVKAFGLTNKKSKGGREFILKRDVESIAQGTFKDYKVFVVSLMSIPRGYNILGDDNNSHFREVFFLKRSFPIPHSFDDAIAFMHLKYHSLRDKECKKLKRQLDEVNKLKKEERATKKGMLLKKVIDSLNESLESAFYACYNTTSWVEANREQRDRIALNGFTLMNQMGGRTQRNANSSIWYFCDGSFCSVEDKARIRRKGTLELGYKEEGCWFEHVYTALNQCKKEGRLSGLIYEPILNALSEMMIEYINSDR